MACQPIRGIRFIGIPKACTDESRLFGNRWLPQMTCAMGPSEKATARQDETRRLADRVLAKSKRKGRLGLIQPPGEGCTRFLI
jgi:hypothetical protein